MTTFNINNWLGENRETVIAKYNDLINEKFFSGISLKSFMIEVLNMMIANNIKSEKRAASILPFVLGNVCMNNSKVIANDSATEQLKEKYSGTATMALV